MLAERLLAQHISRPNNPSFRFLRLFVRPRRSRSRVDFQLIDLVRMMALLARNTVPPAVAIAWLSSRCAPPLGQKLSQITADLDLGADLGELLESWASECPDRLLLELVQNLKLSMDRGTPLADSLESLVETARADFAANLLAKAGSSETKMLIPTIFLILPVTVLFAIYPSMSLLGSGI